MTDAEIVEFVREAFAVLDPGVIIAAETENGVLRVTAGVERDGLAYERFIEVPSVERQHDAHFDVGVLSQRVSAEMARLALKLAAVAAAQVAQRAAELEAAAE